MRGVIGGQGQQSAEAGADTSACNNSHREGLIRKTWLPDSMFNEDWETAITVSSYSQSNREDRVLQDFVLPEA